MTFFDLIKSLIDASKERLKTPITGAFIWSFLIYNWRPIVVLLFSNATIEDRIVVVNSVYCEYSAIITPIVIALIYTVGVPMLMLKIDKILAKTKKDRIEKIYSDKETIMDGKIRIAEKEFELKNRESGNKQIEELLNQIEGLKESNSQMAIAHNNTILTLNKELESINKEFSEVVKKRNEHIAIIENQRRSLDEFTKNKKINSNLIKEATEVIDKLDFETKLRFKSLILEKGKLFFRFKNENKIPNPDHMDELIKLDLVYRIEDEYSFTNLGEIVYIILKMKNEK